VVALNDSADSAQSFMDEGGYDLPVLLDNGQLAGDYGVSVVPTAVFVDADGRVGNSKIGISTVGDLQAFVQSLG
jgi:hypothetical protein